MSYRNIIILVLGLGLGVAGCSTASKRSGPDFTLEEQQAVAADPEAYAPPAEMTSAPVLVPSTNAVVIPAPAAPTPTAPPTPAPATAATTIPTNSFAGGWVSLEQWCQANGFSAPQRISTDQPPAYGIATSNGTMAIRIGSKFAYWNGLEYMLGFPPQTMGGKLFLHSLDVRKNFEPLITRAPGATKTGSGSSRVIVIDPGHGGTDVGTKSVQDGRYEKEFTLDVARRLQALLATNGWTVLLTRTNDSNVALSNRVAFAEQHKADFFLSLHFNSALPDHEQAGLETYCLTPTGMPSNLTRGFQDNAGLSFPNNHFDALNLQYAVLLHRALLKVNGHLDRGIRRARFLGVLQNQNRPAVLVEGGYLSNPREARQIGDPAYRQKLAEALAGALADDYHAGAGLAGHAMSAQAAAPAGTTN